MKLAARLEINVLRSMNWVSSGIRVVEQSHKNETTGSQRPRKTICCKSILQLTREMSEIKYLSLSWYTAYTDTQTDRMYVSSQTSQTIVHHASPSFSDALLMRWLECPVPTRERPSSRCSATRGISQSGSALSLSLRDCRWDWKENWASIGSENFQKGTSKHRRLH